MNISGVHSAANFVYQLHQQSQQQQAVPQVNAVQNQQAMDPDHDGDIDGKGRDIDVRA